MSRSSSRTKGTGAPGRRGTAKSGEPQEVLAELLALGDSKGWVVSCYQKLEPGDRAGEKYRIKLKNRLRRAEARLKVLGFPHADREAVSALLAGIEDFFSDPGRLAGARGAAVFAARGWQRVVLLPYVLKSRVLVDRTPVVGELVALVEHGTRLLVAVADRRAARLFAVRLDGVEELPGLVAPQAPSGRWHQDKGAPGDGEFRFHNRIREEKQRHLARVAEAAGRTWRTGGFDGLVVGGVGVDADALLPHLEPALRDRVVGVLRLAPKAATPAEIRVRALELLAESADHAAADAVGEVEGLLPTRWAVNGLEPTLRALSRGQVRTLVVDHDAEVPGFRLRGSGRLTTTAAAGRAEGEPEPVADVLDDAMEDALRQRARVAVVRGPLARRVDRLAGVLRFRAAS